MWLYFFLFCVEHEQWNIKRFFFRLITAQWSKNGKHSSKPILMWKPLMVICCVFSALDSPPKTLCHHAKHATPNTLKYVPSVKRCATSSHVMLPTPTWKKLSTNFCQIQLQKILKRRAKAFTHCTMFTSAK